MQVMQSSTLYPSIRILKTGVKTMRMFHDSLCPKESYTVLTCGCGFVQEWLEPRRTAERSKINASIPALYSITPDSESKPLIDLSSLLAELRERAKQPSQSLNDEENENE